MNRTLVICKPDAVERGLVGEIVARFERKGLTPRRRRAAHGRPRQLAEEHYEEHVDKPFYGELVAFLTRAPVVAMVVEGPEDNTWKVVRKLMGATNVDDAAPGTIRGDLATTSTENLVHGSDGPESAAREIALWFPDALTAARPARSTRRPRIVAFPLRRLG